MALQSPSKALIIKFIINILETERKKLEVHYVMKPRLFTVKDLKEMIFTGRYDCSTLLGMSTHGRIHL